jgi:hypothetical protein
VLFHRWYFSESGRFRSLGILLGILDQICARNRRTLILIDLDVRSSHPIELIGIEESLLLGTY